MDAYELRIRQTIRNLMEEKKKSADEISATIPVSTATFYRRMSHPSEFTVYELRKIARNLGTTVAEITAGI